VAALTALKRADHIVSELCSSVAVDIVPGPDDPTNFSLPQQPLSPYVLPLAESLSTCNAVTNPHLAVFSGTQ
jgi:DNA polymerase delta subunit 2